MMISFDSKICHKHFANQINCIQRYNQDDNRRNDECGSSVANVNTTFVTPITKNNDNVMNLIPSFHHIEQMYLMLQSTL